MDQGILEEEIGRLIADFQRAHDLEVSSIWVEHYSAPAGIEVTVTTRARVKVA